MIFAMPLFRFFAAYATAISMLALVIYASQLFIDLRRH